MHDLDRTLQQFEGEPTATFEADFVGEDSPTSEAVFDEIEELELAANLLGTNSEEELDQFFGDLLKKAARAAGSALKGPVGAALSGALKNVARTALPMAGAALGNFIVPGVGGLVGGKLAGAAGKMFGLELEGMSDEDSEFEVARRVVRLAGDAGRRAALAPQLGSPVIIAKDAILAAANRHAPGLATTARNNGIQVQVPRYAPPQRGQWIRTGRRIVLFGVYA